jgi:molybdopterin-containing oxidoreductase family iron-sulfur binding subunit
MGNIMSPKHLHATLSGQEANASAPEHSAPAYWRHAAEFNGDIALDSEKHREFPSEDAGTLDATGRRNFMKVMGASMMMAGLTSCARQPDEKIVPYVKPPEDAVAGQFNYYATAVPCAGFALGAVATSYEGRPTKIEGLVEHPASLGSSSIHAQASILDLYSPDRLESIAHVGTMATWNQFVVEIGKSMQGVDAVQGASLAILTETITSPTIAKQMEKLLALYPSAQWFQHDPMGGNNARVGTVDAFGEFVAPVINFKKAKVVLSLDANFLEEGPAHVRYARDFSVTRAASASADAPDYEAREGFAHDEMSRLYVAECTPTLTGSAADHAIRLRYPHVETLARAIAQNLGVAGAAANAENAAALPAEWLAAVLEDLAAHKGSAVVVAGDAQPPVVHSLAHAINAALGAVESGLVTYIASPEARPVDQRQSVAKLVESLNAGGIALLVILGGNPIYNTPADLKFGDALEKAALRVHLASDQNETSNHCHWVVPESHYLEAWGDLRAFDGTMSVVQPLIRPLYNSKSAVEILSLLLGDEASTDYDLVHGAWLNANGVASEPAWKTALAKGLVEGSAFAPKAVTHKLAFGEEAAIPALKGLDLVFRLDPRAGDGRHANNGWLQELPKPLTNLTWDNAVHLHPKTAEKLELKQEDVVLIQYEGLGTVVRGAVTLLYGHPEEVATIHLGYGRQTVGFIGKDRGFNAYAAQTAASPWFIPGASLSATGRTYLLARTEEHNNIEKSHITQAQKAEDRHLVRAASLEAYKHDPEFAKKMGHEAPGRELTLYNPDEKDWAGYAWGMTIDLNRCTGCAVCTIACQAENNIPIVGKKEVSNGREMHWIRVDRYFKGQDITSAAVEVVHQPIPCMQCENAPCEPVCPVGATQHSKEGLNDMAYNRCIGTRYCANNCPYKVRRFNFFHYQIREGQDAPQLKMMRNPNVTVRSRGVMEKCTFCVQRINKARIEAKREDRLIKDGEFQTACQSACPSQAIKFGNINDPQSTVSLSKQNPRDYGLLADIGTRPRTTYLAQLKNVHPNLAKPEAHTAEH